jgi:hypothetical protein
MNDIESSEIIACVAAIDALPIRATSVVKIAKALMSSTHCPPIGRPVRRKRRIAAVRPHRLRP